MRLQDKVILVTASTRGIGLAIAKKCAQEGAKVYMAARDLPDRFLRFPADLVWPRRFMAI